MTLLPIANGEKWSNVFAGLLLGQGAFGKVVKAKVTGIHHIGNGGCTFVAVKMPKGKLKKYSSNFPIKHNMSALVDIH